MERSPFSSGVADHRLRAFSDGGSLDRPRPRPARRERVQAVMMRICVAPLAAALALGLGCRAPTHSAAARSIVFFDDFSGDSLDRTKWTVRVTGRTVNE